MHDYEAITWRPAGQRLYRELQRAGLSIREGYPSDLLYWRESLTDEQAHR